MSARLRRLLRFPVSSLGVGLLLVAAGCVFLAGITWGLPSRAADVFLFGDRPAWSGEEILELAGGWSDDPALGADVDLAPLVRDGRPIPLNETDAQRAEIIRRYRLYTNQPDEMITLRALSSMRPGEGRFDPRLYQYGGLWIYPVGALLKLASTAGFVTLKPDVAWYLDHPEEFGKLYVVTRLYTAAWGLVGVLAVYWIARRLAGGRIWPALFAGLVYICMPVVINMVHEAKPHLPGTVLQLLAVAAAMRYVETGRRAWWLATAALCGAAFGMVLSAWPVFIVLLVMVLLRPIGWGHRAGLAIGGGLAGVGVYLLTNPYVTINLFINRDVLRSNFGNSLAMYEVGRWPEGVLNAVRLATEGASSAVMLVGLFAAAWAAGRLMLNGGVRTDGAKEPRASARAASQACRNNMHGYSGSGSASTGSDDSSSDPQDDSTERPARRPAATEAQSPEAENLSRDPATSPAGRRRHTEPPAGRGCHRDFGTGGRYAVLLAAPAVLILLQFVALAADKPGEYGRFAILPDVALGIAAAVGIAHVFEGRAARAAALAVLTALTAIPGYNYLAGFIADAGRETTRQAAAQALDALQHEGARTLGVFAEPAPYALPPVDLFKWEIVLLPKGASVSSAGQAGLDVMMRAVDNPARAEMPPPGYVAVSGSPAGRPSIISWAAKPFVIWVREEVVVAAAGRAGD